MQQSSLPASSWHLLSRLWDQVREHTGLLLLGIISTIAFSGIDALAIYLTKPFVNKGFIERDMAFIAWFPVILTVGFIVRGIVNFASTFCITYVSRTVIMKLRQTMFSKCMHLPASYYDQNTSGTLLSRLLFDVEQVAQVSAEALTNIIQSSTMIIGLIIVMLTISWQVSAFFLVVAPLIYAVIRASNRYIRRYSQRVQDNMGHLTQVAEESIEGYQDLRLLGAQHFAQTQFNQAASNCRQGDLKAALAKAIGSSMIQVLAALTIAGLLYFMLMPGNVFSLSAGGFSAMLMSMLAILKPLKVLANANSLIQRGLTGAQSVFQFIDSEDESDNGKQHLACVNGEIRFHQVSFAYHDEVVLHNINFTIKAGEVVALVGHSGSGKSTLMKLLPRFYELQQGLISIDGIDIRDLSLQQLRSLFAYVGQRVTLFVGSVAENIAFGCDTMDRDAIIHAAKQAHAHEFISQLPQGYDTAIGENGTLLSGGQRQRLAIARALLRDAPILLLDEATSALDTASERQVQLALEHAMQSRTTIIIAHRLSTIEHADRIIVMHKGHIVEQGTHQSLLQQQGAYASLQHMQQPESAHATVGA